jgi:hypothetical protein
MAVHQPLGVVNNCRACGEDFSSVTAFDRHRVRVHAYTWSSHREDGRRCLIGDELPEAGMELDERGHWRIALTDSERDRLQGLGAKGGRAGRCKRRRGHPTNPNDLSA